MKHDIAGWYDMQNDDFQRFERNPLKEEANGERELNVTNNQVKITEKS